MSIMKLIIFIVLFVISGCTSKTNYLLKVDDQIANHQIYINEEGRLIDPVSNKAIDVGQPEDAYIQNIYSNYLAYKKSNPKSQLTIFIHGGLNTYNTAKSRVNNIKDDMLNEGHYPVFISWNSGPLTNYFDHLFFLRRGEYSPTLGPLSSPFIFLEDSFRALARIPASTYNVLVGQNSVMKSHNSYEEASYNKALKRVKSENFNLHNSPNDKGLGFVDWWSVLNPAKLISAPFVDGLGTGAWNSMLRRTDLVLKNDLGRAGSSETSTAVNTFFTYIKQDNSIFVNLIGHSMGTIISNNILSRYHDIKFHNIVYMAAACTLKDLEKTITPYLSNHSNTTFYNLTLNPYNDISENFFYDFVPRGSLLMWIDDTLATTNSFSERTAGFWFNLIRGASDIFTDPLIQKQVHLTQFGLRDGSPEKHGDFGEYPFWRKAFWLGDHTRTDQ